MKVHFSSQRMNWKTPKAVYQILDAEFNFDYDPCPANYKEGVHFDGLDVNVRWGRCNFINPPYGRELPKWIKRTYEHYEEWRNTPFKKIMVLLIPSRTDTKWWHDYCMKATEIRFIKGRLKFDDQKNPAPFPSAIVIFK